jgi:ubiquinone/menaquinone biosynthesis C-methylase UbiE
LEGEINNQYWRKASGVFHERATEYDRWYEDSLLFQIELAALKDIKTILPEPKLEIGIGSGRFGHELGVLFGLDPALNALQIAKSRGITVCRSVGEALPLQADSVGTIYTLFSLCFMADPAAVLAECHRVLKKEGHLVVGMISAPSPWGKFLQAKKEEGHPFYKYARFYAPFAVQTLCREAGFDVVETRSALTQKPDNVKQFESSRAGLADGAGFVVIIAGKR